MTGRPPDGDPLAPPVRQRRRRPETILPALASQCFLNEYAWAEDAVERQLVERLAGRLDRLSPDEVMTLACYRPLTDLPGAEALLERGWTGGVAEVLDEQIAKPREERALQAGIPTLTPIRGGRL